MTMRTYVLLGVLVVLATILLVRLGSPMHITTSVGSPYTGLEVEQRETSVVAEVFAPAVGGYDRLIDSFRPSYLRQVICPLLPSNPAQVPFNLLFGLVRGCY